MEINKNNSIDLNILDCQSYSNIIKERLPMFLDEKTKAYARMFIEGAMKSLLEKVNNIQTLQIYANTLNMCREFATQNQLEVLQNLCIIWNRKGIEKFNAIKSQNNNNYDEGLGNNIRNHLNNYAEVLDSKMKDMEMIRIIVDKLTDLNIFIEQKGNQIYPPQELEEVKKIINQQLSIANLTISVSDELDADLRIR